MATPPAVPPVPDADRYYTATLVSLTSEIDVPFPVYGDAEDLIVRLDGADLPTTAWGFYSASGATALPITDGRVTFLPSVVGVLEITGNWQPRQLSMATAAGIGRREFNQVVGTVVSSLREMARAIRTSVATVLTPNASGPLANRPLAGAVAAGYVYLQTDDASQRVVFWISDGASTWSQLVATGPTGATGAAGANGLNGSTTGTLRNRIINGNFGINQRGYVSGAASAAGAYAHDRWKAGAAGCTYSFTPAKPDTTISILAGTIKQIIEDVNVEGGSYVLSWTGTATGRVNGGGYAASPIALTGFPGGTAIEVEFTGGTLGQVQFEPGTSQTAFERRPRSYEQLACERYFRWLSLNASGFSYAGYLNIDQALFPTMRAAPTLGSPVADPNLAQSSSNVASYSVSQATPYSATVNVTPTATGAYSLFGYRASADAEL